MRKIIPFLFCLSLQAQAVSVSLNRSSSEGSSLKKYEVDKNKITLEKKSNFFDKKKDLKLGVFNGDGSAKILKELESVLRTIKSTDEFLKLKGKDFNSLSVHPAHESYIKIEDYVVTQNSNLYKKLKTIIDELEGQSWKQQSGVVLSSDLKKITTIKDGKVQNTENFQFAFRCQSEKRPTVCGYKDLGILYVE